MYGTENNRSKAGEEDEMKQGDCGEGDGCEGGDKGILQSNGNEEWKKCVKQKVNWSCKWINNEIT